ncbi:MAG TPA: ATP-binding protein, partial [Actinomycetes bacterium]
HDVGRAGELLESATAKAQEAVQDVRRLVHGLRPPALDDLGLAGALRAMESSAGDGGIRIAVTCRGSVGDLPAAVEVAAFRIAQEALTNTVRHSGATSAAVSLDVADSVVVSVVDDGHGIPAGRIAGVGMASMRERAAELGGSLEVEPVLPQGTRVTATIPLAVSRPVLPVPREVAR